MAVFGFWRLRCKKEKKKNIDTHRGSTERQKVECHWRPNTCEISHYYLFFNVMDDECWRQFPQPSYLLRILFIYLLFFIYFLLEWGLMRWRYNMQMIWGVCVRARACVWTCRGVCGGVTELEWDGDTLQHWEPIVLQFCESRQKQREKHRKLGHQQTTRIKAQHKSTELELCHLSSILNPYYDVSLLSSWV